MRRIHGLLILASCFICPAVARAQAKEDVARADALFNAAKALVDAGQYADACVKFAESQHLAPGLGVTLYLADCYERIGRTASAWTEFRSAEGLARARNDKRADIARQHAQALEPKLDRLSIMVAPTVPRAGLSILRDGLPVPSDEIGLAVPVDPGDHVVVVSSPGRPSRSLHAYVGPEAAAATVSVDSLDEPIAMPAPPPGPPPAPAPGPAPLSTPPVREATPAPAVPVAADPGATQRILGFSAMGAGAAGVAVGSIFGLLAKNALDQSNQGPCNASDHCTAAGLSDRQDASTKATISTVAFVAAGILAAGGAALYLTAPRAAPTTGVQLVPVPLAGGAAGVLRRSF